MTISVDDARSQLIIPEERLRTMGALSRVVAESVNRAIDELIEAVRADERRRVYEEEGWQE